MKNNLGIILRPYVDMESMTFDLIEQYLVDKFDDISIFCDSSSKIKPNCGIFGLTESTTFNGSILCFSVEDVEYVLNSSYYAKPVMFYHGQGLDVIAMMDFGVDEGKYDIISWNAECSQNLKRLFGINCLSFKEYFDIAEDKYER